MAASGQFLLDHWLLDGRVCSLHTTPHLFALALARTTPSLLDSLPAVNTKQSNQTILFDP